MIVQKLLGYSVGKKTLVAVTGVLLSLFLVAHMSGNLLMFVGPDAINAYGEGLRQILRVGDFALGLWIARLGLIVMFVVHVVLAVQLTRQNRAARPIRYEYNNTVSASIASRTMIYSGLVLLLFLIYHLLHFTVGTTHPQHFQARDHLMRHDVYTMVILGFRDPAVLISYVIAMVALGFHLYHGIASLFQTLGLVKQGSYTLLTKIGASFAILLVLGFLSVPGAILFRIIRLPGE